MDKKLKKVLIILILIILILFVVMGYFLSPSSIEKGYQDEKIPTSNQVQQGNDETYKYFPTIENTRYLAMSNEAKTDLDKAIDEIIKILNEKDYEKFYQKLSDECKEYLYPTFEKFKVEYEKKLQNYEYTSEEYMVESYGYECVFYPIDFQGTSENTIELILNIDSETKESTIKLDQLINVREIGTVQKERQLNVTCLSQLNYLDKTVYTLKFVNTGYVKIEIDVSDITAIKTVRGYPKEEKIENIPSFILAGQESKIIELEFDAYNYSSLKPEWLMVNIVKNQEPIKFEYYISNNDFEV